MVLEFDNWVSKFAKKAKIKKFHVYENQETKTSCFQ